MNKLISLLILPAIIFLVLLPNHAWAVGVGTSPKELHFDANSGSTQTLHVINTGDEESSYRVYVEGEYEGWFEISPNEFQLAPDESIKVDMTISPPSSASGEHTAHICVVSLSPSLELRVGAGVKVPAYISLASPTPLVSMPMWIGGAIVLLAVLTGIFLFWRRRKAVEAR